MLDYLTDSILKTSEYDERFCINLIKKNKHNFRKKKLLSSKKQKQSYGNRRKRTKCMCDAAANKGQGPT